MLPPGHGCRRRDRRPRRERVDLIQSICSITGSQASAIRYYLFDLLSDRGKRLLDVPLADRRAALSPKGPPAGLRHPLLISETIEAPSAKLIQSAKSLALEGIIAKRLTSLYEPGRRSDAWLKYKINKGQEFVIGGYTPGNPFDAVIVGYYDGGTSWSLAPKSAPALCRTFDAS